ncbi:hypothetical protein ACFQZ4_01490 [Catellatospora coxensis]
MTVCAAKKSRSARGGVISQVTCLTPFSQMSSRRPVGSSGQAQPGQSKPPSSWFITSSARMPSTGSGLRSSTLPTLRAAPQPAAGWWYSCREWSPSGTGPRPSAAAPGTAPIISCSVSAAGSGDGAIGSAFLARLPEPVGAGGPVPRLQSPGRLLRGSDRRRWRSFARRPGPGRVPANPP